MAHESDFAAGMDISQDMSDEEVVHPNDLVSEDGFDSDDPDFAPASASDGDSMGEYSDEDEDGVEFATEPAAALDLKGNESKLLFDAISSLTGDLAFVESVTDSKLPEGATVTASGPGKQKMITFAAPLTAVMIFSVSAAAKQSWFESDDGLTRWSADSAQLLAHFLLEQECFPQQIALRCTYSFFMRGKRLRGQQEWLAHKSYVCAAFRHNCPTRLLAGFTVQNPKVTVAFASTCSLADAKCDASCRC